METSSILCTNDEEMWPIGFKVERQDTDDVSSPEVLVDSLWRITIKVESATSSTTFWQ